MKPRFQFRLRTLLIVVALLGVVLRVGWEYRTVLERRAWYRVHPVKVEIDVDDIKAFQKFSQGDSARGPIWLRVRLGDEPRRIVYVLDSLPTGEKQAAAALFPEADILVIPKGYPD